MYSNTAERLLTESLGLHRRMKAGMHIEAAAAPFIAAQLRASRLSDSTRLRFPTGHSPANTAKAKMSSVAEAEKMATVGLQTTEPAKPAALAYIVPANTALVREWTDQSTSRPHAIAPAA
jgi:hypothetical protein